MTIPSQVSSFGRLLIKPIPRFEWVCASVALLLGLLLRFMYVIRQPVNSDEPQHLHVAWGWAHGLMEYRDVYDNHTPLFHVLMSPLVWIVGDRPELFMWARLAMIPLWALTLVATYLAGRSLYGRRVGLWATVLAGLLQPMFVKSVEFRTDDLWAMCWMGTIAVLVAGTFTPARGFWTGLLIGLCAGVSIKTGLLVTALGWAALASVALPGSPASHSQRGPVPLLDGLDGGRDDSRPARYHPVVQGTRRPATDAQRDDLVQHGAEHHAEVLSRARLVPCATHSAMARFPLQTMGSRISSSPGGAGSCS